MYNSPFKQNMDTKPSILIIDDQKVMRETIALLLGRQNYELTFAENGTEGLEKAAQINPDLILLDVMMPGMDGFEVCRRLRNHRVLAHVPIVMVTALNDRESWVEGIESGADDFVFKPFDTNELRTRVRNITRLNRYRLLVTERSKFEWVIEQADDGYLMLDQQGRLVYANPQSRVYLGLPVDEVGLIPNTFLELVQKDYRLEPQHAWGNWPEPAPENMLRYLVRPESATAKAFWLSITNLSLPTGLNVSQIIRLRDVTDQMVLQRDVWRFQSMILHKLRTPLTVVLQSLEVLTRHINRLPVDKLSEIANRALSGGQRLQAEVEDILSYLRAPSLAKSGDGFDMSQMDGLARKIAGELGIRQMAIAGLDKLGNVRLKMTGRAMETILWEILENAVKFHPQKEPMIQLFAFRMKSNEVGIWLGDNGVSLSPEQLAQVWVPYYQGEKTFTGEIKGMGLGLPTVASLVWSIGGRCRMYNRPGEPGIVVELVIPVEANPVA